MFGCCRVAIWGDKVMYFWFNRIHGTLEFYPENWHLFEKIAFEGHQDRLLLLFKDIPMVRKSKNPRFNLCIGEDHWN